MVRRRNEPPGYLAPLYRTLLDEAAERASCRMLIDSSNWPQFGRLLHSATGGRIGYIHLVRDPRAALHSRTRRGLQRRLANTSRSRIAASIAQDARRWTVWNQEASELAHLGCPFLTVRYEDLVRDPSATLARIAATFRIDPAHVTNRNVKRVRRHVVWGNRRAVPGTVELVADDRWQSESTRSRQRLAWLITTRHRRRYGYVQRRPI